MPTKQISYGSHQGKLGSTKHDPHVNVDPRLYAYRHGGIGSSNRYVARGSRVCLPIHSDSNRYACATNRMRYSGRKGISIAMAPCALRM